MFAEMILEYLETDRRRADVAHDESFRTFRDDVIGQSIHLDKLVAGETPRLIVIIVHMTGYVGLQDVRLTQGAFLEHGARGLMMWHLCPLAGEPAFALDMIIRAHREYMFRHLDVRILIVTVRACFYIGILIHHEVIDTERLVLVVMMRVAG